MLTLINNQVTTFDVYNAEDNQPELTILKTPRWQLLRDNTNDDPQMTTPEDNLQMTILGLGWSSELFLDGFQLLLKF